MPPAAPGSASCELRRSAPPRASDADSREKSPFMEPIAPPPSPKPTFRPTDSCLPKRPWGGVIFGGE